VLEFKATLDEGPRSKVQRNGAFLMVESHKLDPRILDEDLSPNETKLKWYLHGTVLDGNSIGLDQKWSSKENSWFGKPRCKLGSKVVSSIVFHYFSLFFIVFQEFFFTCS
jgi:hypothetical protein